MLEGCVRDVLAVCISPSRKLTIARQIYEYTYGGPERVQSRQALRRGYGVLGA